MILISIGLVTFNRFLGSEPLNLVLVLFPELDLLQSIFIFFILTQFETPTL